MNGNFLFGKGSLIDDVFLLEHNYILLVNDFEPE